MFKICGCFMLGTSPIKGPVQDVRFVNLEKKSIMVESKIKLSLRWNPFLLNRYYKTKFRKISSVSIFFFSFSKLLTDTYVYQ